MASRSKNLPVGTTIIGIQLPEALHESMKQLRKIRWQQDGVDPKLSRMYREAVEQYVNAKPQQNLLEEFGGNGTRKASRAARN